MILSFCYKGDYLMSSKKYTVVISYKNSRNGIIKEMIDTFLQIASFFYLLPSKLNKTYKVQQFEEMYLSFL